MKAISRIFDIPYWQLEKTPIDEALVAKEGGRWVAHSSAQLVSTAEKFAKGLIAKGVNRGDVAAIISANRPEWNMADYGIQMSGAINVPLYITLSESEIVFI